MRLDEPTYCDGPPKVLHLVHGLNFGGIENWLLAALRHMPREKFPMDICHKGPGAGELADQVRATGARVLSCPLGPVVLPFIGQLKTILGAGRYSLLHVHTHAHSGPAVYAAKAVGVPVVTTFHSTERQPQTRLTRLPGIRNLRGLYARRSVCYALQNSAVSNGVSCAVAEAVTKAVGLPQSHCEVFYLGCERPQRISGERLSQYRRELQLQESNPVIVHVGSFRVCKNHESLLQAFRKIVDAIPNAILLLAGDGPLRPTIQQQIQQLNLARHVRLLGLRRDATALMQLGDVFMFPSHYEGLSVALMEACAVGLPIVASDIPGNREATCAGMSARLHSASDVEGMAKSAIELLFNPDEGNRLGECGREYFEQTFAIEASVERLVSLYSRVLGMHQSENAAHQVAA
jgi:glycosyltransferase involved in cell wall biosynthesis